MHISPNQLCWHWPTNWILLNLLTCILTACHRRITVCTLWRIIRWGFRGIAPWWVPPSWKDNEERWDCSSRGIVRCPPCSWVGLCRHLRGRWGIEHVWWSHSWVSSTCRVQCWVWFAWNWDTLRYANWSLLQAVTAANTYPHPWITNSSYSWSSWTLLSSLSHPHRYKQSQLTSTSTSTTARKRLIFPFPMRSTRSTSSRLLSSARFPSSAALIRRFAGRWSLDSPLKPKRSVWSLSSALILEGHPRGNFQRMPGRISWLLSFSVRERRFLSWSAANQHQWSYCLNRYNCWWLAWYPQGWNYQLARWSYTTVHVCWTFQVPLNYNYVWPSQGIISSIYQLNLSWARLRPLWIN